MDYKLGFPQEGTTPYAEFLKVFKTNYYFLKLR